MQNENNLHISPSLANLKTIDYRKVKDFQGNLKSLSPENFERLRTVLFGADGVPAQGFVYPLYVWIDGKGAAWALDGHQRLKVLRELNAQPYEIPYVEIECTNKADAKKKLLSLNSNFGQITHAGFSAFAADVDKSWLAAATTLENFAMPQVDFQFAQAGAGVSTPMQSSEQSANKDDFNLDDFFEKNSNSELNTEKKSFKIILEYSQEDYDNVLQALKKHTGTKEDIIAKLLGV